MRDFIRAVKVLAVLSPLFSFSTSISQFCNDDGTCQKLPKSIASLVSEISDRNFGPRFVFIPKGRSLQKRATSFVDPRIVSISGDGNLFIGYSKNDNQLEIIQKNPVTQENEFFLVSNYPANPTLTKQGPDSKCFECHKGGELLFANAPWSETNANPIVAFEMCLAMRKNGTEYTNTYEGLKFAEDCEALEKQISENPLIEKDEGSSGFESAFALDLAARKNQTDRYYDKKVCEQLCQLHSNPKECKNSLMKFILLGLNVSPLPINFMSDELDQYYTESINQSLDSLSYPEDQVNTLRNVANSALGTLAFERYPPKAQQHFLEDSFSSVLADMTPPTPLAEAFLKSKTPLSEFEAIQSELKRRQSPTILMHGNNERPTFDLALGSLVELSRNPEFTAGSEKKLIEQLKLRRFLDVKSKDDVSLTKYTLSNPMESVEFYRYGPVPPPLFSRFMALSYRNSCLKPFIDLELRTRLFSCRNKIGTMLSQSPSLMFAKYFSQHESNSWNSEERAKIAESLREFAEKECPKEERRVKSSPKFIKQHVPKE